MQCDRAREAVSAQVDGEDTGLPGGALDAHLAACCACRDWRQRAHEVTRRVRLGGPVPDRDLAAAVLAALPPARSPGRRRRLVQRGGLIAVALAQLAVTVPLLILGHDHGADAHAAHELGSFDLALAIAFAAGAFRPALSAGLAWPCGAAAASLVITAITDLFSGQTIGADEAPHLIAAAGAALLLWQARTGGTRSGQAVLATPRPQDVPRPEGPEGVPRPERARAARQPADLPAQTPLGPGGGDAAEAGGPDVAAREDGKQDGRVA